MKAFEETVNTRALEVAAKALFGNDGHGKLVVAYQMIHTEMSTAYNTGMELGAKQESAKIDELRRIERDRGYQLGLQDGRESMRVGGDPDMWAERSPTYAAETKARLGGAAAALEKEEFELQTDSGDETPSTYKGPY